MGVISAGSVGLPECGHKNRRFERSKTEHESTGWFSVMGSLQLVK